MKVIQFEFTVCNLLIYIFPCFIVINIDTDGEDEHEKDVHDDFPLTQKDPQ